MVRFSCAASSTSLNPRLEVVACHNGFAANLAGNVAKEQITAGFNAHVRPALPSTDTIQSSVVSAQSALRSAQTSLAAQAQQSNLENRFSRPKNKLSAACKHC